MNTVWPIPLWTLRIELIVSFWLPLLAVVLARAPVAFAIGTGVLSLVVASGAWEAGETISYLPAFLAGALIARYRPALARLDLRNRAWLGIALLGVLVLLFGRNAFVADFRGHYSARSAIIVEAAGAALLIAALGVRGRMFGVLHHRAVIRLGDISYSLYLLHMPVLALLAGFYSERSGLRIFDHPLPATLILTSSGAGGDAAACRAQLPIHRAAGDPARQADRFARAPRVGANRTSPGARGAPVAVGARDPQAACDPRAGTNRGALRQTGHRPTRAEWCGAWRHCPWCACRRSPDG